ncbi:Crp/Fnr family transcriptional regulator [Pseudomonas piscis]
MNMQQWREGLKAGQWFSHLPASLQDSLLDGARLRRLAPGQYLFHRGDPPCGLYAVVDGAVRVGAVSAQGKEALLSLVEAPHWFGEICLFDGQPRTHDACAEGACTLLQVPQPILLQLLEEQPQYWRQFALLMSHKLRLAFINLEQLSLMPAPARVANRLLAIAAGYGEVAQSRSLLQLPQEQLALMLSLSRQTTNQILKDLQNQGILRLSYGEIEILDPERLRALARFV